MAIDHIGFLTPGYYPEGAPEQGLEDVLKLFAHGEALGFDGAWVRSRHLERGVASAATVLAAASQRTSRVQLGTGVIQLGYEQPFRLAEDLATVDVLSKGRLHIGVSAGPPGHAALIGDDLFDGHAAEIDFSHARALRLRQWLKSEPLGDEATVVVSAAGPQRPRLQPVAKGLADRLWYGGGSLRSAEWAGRNGFNLLVGNLCQGENTDDFYAAQKAQIERFRAHWVLPDRAPRIALGRVIVPWDSADPGRKQAYKAFAESRLERTLSPQGERRILFRRDLVGAVKDILDDLSRDPILPLVNELRLELPYDLSYDAYAQILHDVRSGLAPALGWHQSAA